MSSIPFTKPGLLAEAIPYVEEVLHSGKLAGNQVYTQKCHEYLNKNFGSGASLLTPSCTHALELAALLLNIEPGDEVIMPSYTFTSTATAFVLRRAKIVFVDIDPKTMNVDPQLMIDAITPKTKALVVMHYAGIACDMEKILEVARLKKIAVVEDAAQGLFASWRGKPLGTLGDLGCFSFHETKNITCGEGGAIWCRANEDFLRAEVIREKGTNRSQFFRGMVDKYNWRDQGSSYLPSDLQAAVLYSQFEHSTKITKRRVQIWDRYFKNLKALATSGRIELPFLPQNCEHNGHLFFIKCRDINDREKLIQHLKNQKISTAFHYVPLHSAPAGQKFGRMHGSDRFTTQESERLLRLPLYYDLQDVEVDKICDLITDFAKS